MDTPRKTPRMQWLIVDTAEGRMIVDIHIARAWADEYNQDHPGHEGQVTGYEEVELIVEIDAMVVTSNGDVLEGMFTDDWIVADGEGYITDSFVSCHTRHQTFGFYKPTGDLVAI